MNNIELIVAEEANVETTEKENFELSLSELDMVGGGNFGTILA